jgi:hypothetical protein
MGAAWLAAPTPAGTRENADRLFLCAHKLNRQGAKDAKNYRKADYRSSRLGVLGGSFFFIMSLSSQIVFRNRDNASSTCVVCGADFLDAGR